MRGQRLWVVLSLVTMGLILHTFPAVASNIQVNDTINIEVAVGDEIYYEFYRDNNHIDGVAFVAKRDGGNYPEWGDIIFNSFEYGNPRTAYIKTTAHTAGEWSFRAGVFETPSMSKQENRIYTVQVNIRVRATNGSNNPVWPSNPGNSTSSYGTGYVLCESLSVRTQPNSANDAFAQLSYATTFSILAVDGIWYKVNCDGTVGWVNGQYVLINPQYYYTQNETAAYAYPNANAQRVGLIDANKQLAIIADIDGYYVVSMRGASAFIKK